tara:strand:+ start:1020 stop:1169 length:150 start_codon:yes stop_codon:yes gene_type:complete
MANIKTQFLISKEIKNHELFLKKNRAQATSQQVGGWAHSPQAFFVKQKD